MLTILISLSSCGLKAVYNRNTQLENGKNFKEELAAIEIKIIQERKKFINQKLKFHLEDILNYDSIEVEPKYILEVTLKTNEISSYTTSVGTSGRSNISLNASYILKDIESQDIISKNTTSTNDNNNITNNRFATYISQETIEINLTKIIAENIRNLIINDFIK